MPHRNPNQNNQRNQDHVRPLRHLPVVRAVQQPQSIPFPVPMNNNVPLQRRTSNNSQILPSQLAKVIKPVATPESIHSYSEKSVTPEPITKVDTNGIKSPSLMKPSVQNRLAVIKRTVSNEEERSHDLVQEVKHIPLEWWATENMSVVSRLEQYCSLKQLPPPNYTYFKVKEGKQYKFQCRVTIEDSTYSTYPEDFDTKEKARIVCAARAVESIKLRQGMTQYPLFDGDRQELACKIFDIVSAHKTGVFLTEVPNLFR